MTDPAKPTPQPPTPVPAPTPAPAPAAPAGPPKADEPLGEGGKKALEAERTAREAAEKELKTLRGELDTFKTSLAEAFGVKPDSGTTEDAVKQMQQRLDTMQHDSEVYRLAAQHQITEQGDIDLLRAAKDPETMTRLAERLAAKGSNNTPGTPKPDATQGGSGSPSSSGSPAQEFAQFLGAQLGR